MDKSQISQKTAAVQGLKCSIQAVQELRLSVGTYILIRNHSEKIHYPTKYYLLHKFSGYSYLTKNYEQSNLNTEFCPF